MEKNQERWMNNGKLLDKSRNRVVAMYGMAFFTGETKMVTKAGPNVTSKR